MEVAAEQKTNAEIIQKAWEDAQFKEELLKNPVATMEKFAGQKLKLAEGQKLVVVDQTDPSTVYFNIPKKIDVDNVELTEEQLETVAGGADPVTEYLVGKVIDVVLWATT